MTAAFTGLMTRTEQDHTTTLVLGATGKTGSRVAERLATLGVPTRLGSRSAATPFDWEDRATWEPALRGVGAVYISYYPDLAVPGATETVTAFAELAVRMGARRLVLLSGRGEDEAQHAEQAVRATGADLTSLRAGWFNQNFSESFMLEPVLAGELALPAGDVAEPFVDVDDIAEVAAVALTEDGHVGQIYELTGPRLLTFADVAAEISAATGREIRYVPITPEQLAAGMTEAGEPAEVVGLVSYLFTEVLDGRNSSLTDGVQRALGRPPRDFADYARAMAASGVWDAPVVRAEA
ncbi:NmrA family protein [Conexibacter woesei DSM 14684]|uniref:NmrA family protein n=2 Tax=Conexibacter TaxID=191494 RepID=D3FBG6_CONWI|nr:NmrA family protein [Conexibacter woesei DSM 14684]